MGPAAEMRGRLSARAGGAARQQLSGCCNPIMLREGADFCLNFTHQSRDLCSAGNDLRRDDVAEEHAQEVAFAEKTTTTTVALSRLTLSICDSLLDLQKLLIFVNTEDNTKSTKLWCVYECRYSGYL